MLAKFSQNPQFKSWAEELDREGVLILPSYLGNEDLQACIEDYSHVRNVKNEADQYTWIDPSHLKCSIPFSKLATDPMLVGLTSYYWGKDVSLARVEAYILRPYESSEYGSFQWHHDCEHKRIKVMTLLTDVEADGQRMEYLPGTHKTWRTWKNYDESRYTDEEVSQHQRKISCHGPAGTVVLFDTNGIHRGNRNTVGVRKVWTNVYTAGHNQLEGLELCPDYLEKHSRNSEPFHLNNRKFQLV